MKKRHLRPVHATQFRQPLQEPELRVPGGQNRRRGALTLHGFLQQALDAVGDVFGQCVIGRKNLHGELVNAGGTDGRGGFSHDAKPDHCPNGGRVARDSESAS